jgi:hypothetical protein
VSLPSAPVRPLRRPAWHDATVAVVASETPNAGRLVLDVPSWPGNDPGQHLDLRLTAEDGYQATRSYSIASAGDGTRITLAVDRVEDGEVSPFLVDAIEVGDTLEVHGPLGGWFVWRPDVSAADPRPVQLIATPSGHPRTSSSEPNSTRRSLRRTRHPSCSMWSTAGRPRPEPRHPPGGSHGIASQRRCCRRRPGPWSTSAARHPSSNRCCAGSANSAMTSPRSVRSGSAEPDPTRSAEPGPTRREQASPVRGRLLSSSAGQPRTGSSWTRNFCTSDFRPDESSTQILYSSHVEPSGRVTSMSVDFPIPPPAG